MHPKKLNRKGGKKINKMHNQSKNVVEETSKGEWE